MAQKATKTVFLITENTENDIYAVRTVLKRVVPIQRPILPLEGEYYVVDGDRLPSRVLGVCHRVADHVL